MDYSKKVVLKLLITMLGLGFLMERIRLKERFSRRNLDNVQFLLPWICADFKTRFKFPNRKRINKIMTGIDLIKITET